MKKTIYTSASLEAYIAPETETINMLSSRVLCSSIEGFERNEDSEEWF